MIKIKLIVDEPFSDFLDLYAIVDDDQSHLLNFKWKVNRGPSNYGLVYPYRFCENKGFIKMHREIMNPDEKMIVHHINGNTLDNRKSNLQILPLKEHASMKKVPKIKKRKNSVLISIIILNSSTPDQ